MKSFTAFSADGMLELIVAQRRTGESYPITLNATDFERFVNTLHEQATKYDDETSEWAGSLLSGIAETLGIEFI